MVLDCEDRWNRNSESPGNLKARLLGGLLKVSDVANKTKQSGFLMGACFEDYLLSAPTYVVPVLLFPDFDVYTRRWHTRNPHDPQDHEMRWGKTQEISNSSDRIVTIVQDSDDECVDATLFRICEGVNNKYLTKSKPLGMRENAHKFAVAETRTHNEQAGTALHAEQMNAALPVSRYEIDEQSHTLQNIVQGVLHTSLSESGARTKSLATAPSSRTDVTDHYPGRFVPFSPHVQEPTELSGGPDLGRSKSRGQCVGDCESSPTGPNCAAGLKCFHRQGFTPVPGCTGVGVFAQSYCFDPRHVLLPRQPTELTFETCVTLVHNTEGFGAQYSRTRDIYHWAREVGDKWYCHTPLFSFNKHNATGKDGPARADALMGFVTPAEGCGKCEQMGVHQAQSFHRKAQRWSGAVRQEGEREIRGHFALGLKSLSNEEKATCRFSSNRTNVAVHIRRGDSITYKHGKRPNASIDTFAFMLNRLRNETQGKRPLFHIYSEGPDSDFVDLVSADVMMHNKADDLLSFYCMVVADQLVTSSQTTFSTRAAMLSSGTVYEQSPHKVQGAKSFGRAIPTRRVPFEMLDIQIEPAIMSTITKLCTRVAGEYDLNGYDLSAFDDIETVELCEAKCIATKRCSHLTQLNGRCNLKYSGAGKTATVGGESSDCTGFSRQREAL
jgi:hypothetical protein